jgi:sulfite exporter TauE/SafE
MFLLAAISLGFLGSFHCIGMCGPIALTIPVKRNSRFSIISGSLVYNLGRVLTYGCMGLLFGLLGKGFVLAGWQNVLSITLGITILLMLFVPNFSAFPIKRGLFMSLLEKLKSKIRQLFGIHTYRSLLFIGLLNGLLPCGLVYLGIAGSIATGDAIKGALFMMIFGIGTIPAMLAITVVRDYISIRFRERVRKVVPVFAGLMAVLLILRGLNLGIPYVSPSIKTANGLSSHQCCHNKK